MEKPLDTRLGVVFWTDVPSFRQIQDLLKEKHGFVNARGWDQKFKDDEWFDDTLVYEENGNGVYRCSFHRPLDGMKNPNEPNLEFKYFPKGERAIGVTDDGKLQRDPMRDVVLEVYELLKPVRVTDYGCEDVFSME